MAIWKKNETFHAKSIVIWKQISIFVQKLLDNYGRKGISGSIFARSKRFLGWHSRTSAQKIYYNIIKVASGIKDSELFKKLEDSNDIWEFRTQYNGIQYRLLAFWDEKAKCLVVATHGFIKKRMESTSKRNCEGRGSERTILQEIKHKCYGDEGIYNGRNA